MAVAASSSLPGGLGFDIAAAKLAASSVPASGLTTVSVVNNLPAGISGNNFYNFLFVF